ncbi:MAG: hypothetical protein ABI355_03695 [Solirubrobacteraceae bacterium]
MRSTQTSALADGRGGLAMFLTFTAAVLTSTAAVALPAVVGGWWMLGVALAVHVAMTGVVVLTIFYVMGSRAVPSADEEQLPSQDHRPEGRRHARPKPVTAVSAY